VLLNLSSRGRIIGQLTIAAGIAHIAPQTIAILSVPPDPCPDVRYLSNAAVKSSVPRPFLGVLAPP